MAYAQKNSQQKQHGNVDTLNGKGKKTMKHTRMMALRKVFGTALMAGTLIGATHGTVFAADPVPDPATQVECGDVIGPNETVVLDGNVGYCPGPQPALTVIGPATLDLNGYVVVCEDEDDGNYGIFVIGRGAKVRNGSVGLCSRGVYLQGEGRHRVERILAGSNKYSGIQAHSDNNRISNSEAYGNEYNGIVVDEGNRNFLKDNKAGANEAAGFVVWGQTKLLKNEAFENEYGFAIHGDKTVLQQNFAYENDEVGFDVKQYAKKTRLIRNRAEHNDVGIRVQRDAEANTIMRNISVGNTDYDMEDETTDCGSNKWRNNTFVISGQSCID